MRGRRLIRPPNESCFCACCWRCAGGSCTLWNTLCFGRVFNIKELPGGKPGAWILFWQSRVVYLVSRVLKIKHQFNLYQLPEPFLDFLPRLTLFEMAEEFALLRRETIRVWTKTWTWLLFRYITSRKRLKIHKYMKRNERVKQTSPELQPVISEGCWISFISYKRGKKMVFANAAAAVQVWYFKFSALAHF